MVGRVRKIYDFHGAKKLKIVSNGVTYSVLEEDVTLDE